MIPGHTFADGQAARLAYVLDDLKLAAEPAATERGNVTPSDDEGGDRMRTGNLPVVPFGGASPALPAYHETLARLIRAGFEIVSADGTVIKAKTKATVTVDVLV